jgi:hypothetical protein
MLEPDDLHPSLARTLRALAEDDDLRRTPSDVEDRLRGEIRSIARARRRRVYLSSIGALIGLTVTISLVFWPSHPEHPSVQSGNRAESAARELMTAFFPLMYSDVPSIAGHLVRLEVPRTALVAFGLEPADAIRVSDPPTMVYADVLVGEDGLARSVRFVLPFDDAQGRPARRLENRR